MLELVLPVAILLSFLSLLKVLLLGLLWVRWPEIGSFEPATLILLIYVFVALHAARVPRLVWCIVILFRLSLIMIRCLKLQVLIFLSSALALI